MPRPNFLLPSSGPMDDRVSGFSRRVSGDWNMVIGAWVAGLILWLSGLAVLATCF